MAEVEDGEVSCQPSAVKEARSSSSGTDEPKDKDQNKENGGLKHYVVSPLHPLPSWRKPPG